MRPHVCPWWGGYFIDNRLRRLLHRPERILAPFLQEGDTAIDFGCGMGFFSIAMARLVGPQGRVISIDLQQQMLDVLAKRAAKAELAERIRTHRCEVDRIHLQAAADFALAFYSLHEAPQPQQTLDQIHDLLRPGGALLLVEPIGHVRAAHFDDLLDMGRQAGLTAEQRPRVRLGHAALLRKSNAGQPATSPRSGGS